MKLRSRYPGRASAAGAAASLALLVWAGAAHGLGDLSRERGACLSSKGDVCSRARGLGGGLGVVVSPDGRNLYVASYAANTVAVFARDRAGGRLRQARGSAGCISEEAKPGCGRVRKMDEPTRIRLSPDGRNAYVTAPESGSVAIFDRDPATGVLRQKAGAAGCISGSGDRACVMAASLHSPSDIAVSPDGRSAYVVDSESSLVAVLRRDPATGDLREAQATPICLPAPGCRNIELQAVLVSPDGRNVYAIGYEPRSVDSKDRPTKPFFSVVVAFARDPETGALMPVSGQGGCVASAAVGACQVSAALGAGFAAAISADGRNLYVVSVQEGTIVILDRDPATGGLSQPPGRTGCLARVGAKVRCMRVAGMDTAWTLAVSPDGRSVYVGGDRSLITFRRRPATGTLTQSGCLTSEPSRGTCRRDSLLSTVTGLAVSPDGRAVYASLLYPSVLATFRRETGAGRAEASEQLIRTSTGSTEKR